MKQSATSQSTVSEREVRITWRQWPDGRWEAWIADDTGFPPHVARDHAELERLLGHTDKLHERESCSSEPNTKNH